MAAGPCQIRITLSQAIVESGPRRALRAAGVLGAIVLALLTNLPVSFFVTSLSFVCYLLGRFAVGPCLLGWERSARAALRRL